MTETEAYPGKSFVLPKQQPGASRQPLELYHLSHDLRGPLNSILGFAELLLEGIEGPINEIQTEDLNAIYQSAQTLLKLINTVVDLSKLEADRLVLNMGPVRLHAVVAKVLASIYEVHQSNQVELNITVPDSFPELQGEHDRVEQMLFNLVNFALNIKHVTEVKVTVSHNEKEATIQIIAVGGEMLPEELAGLFDLAVELDTGGRSKLGRGGLEMPLVQRLARAHRGQIWVEGQAEAGAYFYLQLPLYRPN